MAVCGPKVIVGLRSCVPGIGVIRVIPLAGGIVTDIGIVPICGKRGIILAAAAAAAAAFTAAAAAAACCCWCCWICCCCC